MEKLDYYLEKIKIFEEREDKIFKKQVDIKKQYKDLQHREEQNNTISSTLETLKQALHGSKDGRNTYMVNEIAAQYENKLRETNIQLEDHTDLNDKIIVHKSLMVKRDELENKRTALSEQESKILSEQADHRERNEFGESYYEQLDQIKGDASEFEAQKAIIISNAHEEQILASLDLKIKKTNISERFQNLCNAMKSEFGERVTELWNPNLLADVPTESKYYIESDEIIQHASEQINQLDELLNVMSDNKVDTKMSSQGWSDVKKVGKPFLIIGGVLALLGIAFGAFWTVLTALVYVLMLALYIAPILVIVLLFGRGLKIAAIAGIVTACISWPLTGLIDNWADHTWYKAQEAFLTFGSVFSSPIFWIAIAIIVLFIVSWFILLKTKSKRLYYQAKKWLMKSLNLFAKMNCSCVPCVSIMICVNV